MKARDLTGITTADIIAALDGNRDALTKVRGYKTGCWLRTIEGDAAAQRLAELSGRWAPPQGERIAGVPPWRGGRLLRRATP